MSVTVIARQLNHVLLVLGMAFALGACGTSESWEGFAYPNRNDLTKHKSLGAFQSLEDCRNAARAALAELGVSDRGDYECGKNCEFNPDMGDIRVCEETSR